MPPETRPPDMVGAGVYQQPQDPASLISLLRSQGSLPTEALMSMMGPQPSASPLASALLGGVAMMPGQTGAQQAVQLNQQQAQFQQQQQMQQAWLYQRVQEQRLAREERQQALYLKIADDALASSEQTTRDWGAHVKTGIFKKLNLPVPPSLAQGLARRRLSPEDLQKALTYMARGADDDTVSALFPNLQPDEIKILRGSRTNRQLATMIGADPDKAQKDALDLELKQAQVIKAKHPELNGDPKLTQRMLMIYRKMFPGEDYLDAGNQEHQERAFTAAVLQERQDFLAQFEEQERIRAKYARLAQGGRSVAESTAHWVNTKGDPAPSWMDEATAQKEGYFKITTQEFDGINTAQQAFVILQNMRETIREMKDRHLFVEEGGLVGAYQQAKLFGQKHLGDPATSKRLLNTWGSQKSQMIILLRLLGDKMRAVSAFAPAADALAASAGAQSAEQILGQVESEIRALAKKSRMPDAVGSVPHVFPKEPIEQVYARLRQRGLADADIKKELTLLGY